MINMKDLGLVDISDQTDPPEYKDCYRNYDHVMAWKVEPRDERGQVYRYTCNICQITFLINKGKLL